MKGYDQLPKSVLEKRKYHRKFTKNERQIAKGYSQMRKDCELDPRERVKQIDYFLKEYNRHQSGPSSRKKAPERKAIPDSTKSLYGQIGFSKWNGEVLPVLILGPNDVCLDRRNEWIDMDDKVRLLPSSCFVSPLTTHLVHKLTSLYCCPLYYSLNIYTFTGTVITLFL